MAITLSSSKGGGNYEPCPEYQGRAVCVDITPLKTYETQYGTKQKFKVAFELEIQDQSRNPVQPWVVMTAPMTPSLHEKAGLTKFLKDWFGRPMSEEEANGLNLDTLIGRPAFVVIAHEKSQDGTKTYANIKLIMPHKHGEPLKPSGLWVRLEDRPPREDDQGKAPAPAPAPVKLADVKVHVGKFKGIPVSELTPDAIRGLAEHWLPKAKISSGKTPEDIQLIAAVTKRLEEINKIEEPNFDDFSDVPF
jgi:hypothetical protein